MSAEDDPRKTDSLLELCSAEKIIVASCVLSPSSARKIAVKIVSVILKSMLVPCSSCCTLNV